MLKILLEQEICVLWMQSLPDGYPWGGRGKVDPLGLSLGQFFFPVWKYFFFLFLEDFSIDTSGPNTKRKKEGEEKKRKEEKKIFFLFLFYIAAVLC